MDAPGSTLKKKTHVKSNKESKAMADLTIVEKQEEGERKIYQRSKSQLQCFFIYVMHTLSISLF